MHSIYVWKILHFTVIRLPGITPDNILLQITHVQEEMLVNQGFSLLNPLPFQENIRQDVVIKKPLPVLVIFKGVAPDLYYLPPPTSILAPTPDRKILNNCSTHSLVSLYQPEKKILGDIVLCNHHHPPFRIKTVDIQCHTWTGGGCNQEDTETSLLFKQKKCSSHLNYPFPPPIKIPFPSFISPLNCLNQCNTLHKFHLTPHKFFPTPYHPLYPPYSGNTSTPPQTRYDWEYISHGFIAIHQHSPQPYLQLILVRLVHQSLQIL